MYLSTRLYASCKVSKMKMDRLSLAMSKLKYYSIGFTVDYLLNEDDNCIKNSVHIFPDKIVHYVLNRRKEIRN